MKYRYICPMCLNTFEEYPSNSFCPFCKNEDDFIKEFYDERDGKWVEMTDEWEED